MINEALSFLTTELNTYLKNHFSLTEDAVVLSPVTDFTGQIPIQNQNKIVLTLINIKEETAIRNSPGYQKVGQSSVKINPSLYINLFVLVSANFSTYQEGLKFIAAGISFFQRTTVFKRTEFAALNAVIDPLVVELDSTSYQEWSYLWGMLGGKYLPSVIYKIKMLTIQESKSSVQIPLIYTIESTVIREDV